MKIRAISLWQPYASAIAVGSKLVETRSWSTKYRGPLAIHAAKRRNVTELIYLSCCWNWCGALQPMGLRMGGNEKLHKLLPFGAIVAVCDLTDCRPTDSFTVGELDTLRRPDGDKSDSYVWTERSMGNFEPGRFGWVLENVRRLAEPIPWKGKQGFFNVEIDDALILQKERGMSWPGTTDAMRSAQGKVTAAKAALAQAEAELAGATNERDKEWQSHLATLPQAPCGNCRHAVGNWDRDDLCGQPCRGYDLYEPTPKDAEG